MTICHYPVLFTGKVEVIPGTLDNAWVIYSTLRHYDVEVIERGTVLGYSVARYRLKAAPEMVSGWVNILCFRDS